MRAMRRILVAVKDPAARSQPAIAKAAQLAKAFDATLELFHSISLPVYLDAYSTRSLDLQGLQRQQRDILTERLERLATGVRRHGVEATVRVDWDYPVYEAIMRRALGIGADLVVAERHAGKRHAKWLLSFTDWELLRLASCPVLIVKTPRPYHRPAILAALDPTHAYSKPARLDDAILAAGGALQAKLRGSLHAMHAYMPAPILPAGAGAAGYSVAAQIEADAEADAKAALTKALKKQRVAPRNRHLVCGHPIDAIPAAARATRAAIVVMGAISRSGLKRVFIGNTAEQVLDALPCDVLVVKPARFAGRVPRRQRGVRVLASPSVL